MPNREKAREKASFLEDSLKVLGELLGKLVKALWELIKRALKYFKKEYL